MVGTVKTMLILSVASAMIVSVANAATVEEIVTQFKEFGPKYVNYRKMENNPAGDKETVLQVLLSTIEAKKWVKFYLGSIDIAAVEKGNNFFSHFNVLYSYITGRDRNNLSGIAPLSLFEDPKIKYTDYFKLNEIRDCAKSGYANFAGTPLNQVACHYELFNGQDLEKKDDSNARKEYMLILLATGTE